MSEPQPVAVNDESAAVSAPPKGALLTIFLIVFIDLLGFGLIIPLLPFYALKYSASPFEVEMLQSVYSFCQFLASPILGLISDRVGRRPVLILSQIGSVAGYLLLGWATQHPWATPATGLMMIYVSRLIDGLSGGNISTAAAYISDVTGPENRAKGMGLIGAAFGLGFIFGPAAGGMLGHINPSVPAYAAAFLSAGAALMTSLKLRESLVHRPAESEVWLHPKAFAPILRRPVLLQLMLIWFACMAAYTMMDASAAMFLNDIFGFGPLQVGLYFAFVGCIIALVQGGLIGRVTKKVGEWIPASLGVLLVSIGAFGTLATAWKPAIWLLGLGGIITAAGRSLQQPTMSSLVSKHAERHEQGVTMGLFQGMGSLARGFGPFIGGLAYGHAGASHPIRPYLGASAILFLAGIWTWTVKSGARE
ncbi:MAG TPA: MFS transporter [Tepidisphaeraceae bacterium]|jgi:DHA1 family tetracycline resistance protein-like MFS transporter